MRKRLVLRVSPRGLCHVPIGCQRSPQAALAAKADPCVPSRRWTKNVGVEFNPHTEEGEVEEVYDRCCTADTTGHREGCVARIRHSLRMHKLFGVE